MLCTDENEPSTTDESDRQAGGPEATTYESEATTNESNTQIDDTSTKTDGSDVNCDECI